MLAGVKYELICVPVLPKAAFFPMKHTHKPEEVTVRKQLISLALLAMMPLAAQAQEEDESGFNWNAAATSEYLFRGISQTDDHPAIQAGAGYSWSNGLYLGAWASNVDCGEDTDAEVDTFIGWNGDVTESVNLDVQLVRYNYIGEPAGVDYAYNELIGKATFAET